MIYSNGSILHYDMYVVVWMMVLVPFTWGWIGLPRFRSPAFRITDGEVHKSILHKLPDHQDEVVKGIKGFYGVVGPDINMSNVNTLYDLFTGNGLVQGVFFENGHLTFIRKYIRTDKLLWEAAHGRIPTDFMNTAIGMVFYRLRMMPNMMGMANTALFNVDRRIYALFEQDLPYELDIDFDKKLIETRGRAKVPGLFHFSAHSKYNWIKRSIETMDYDILTQSVTFFIVSGSLVPRRRFQIRPTYMPIVHDFVSTPTSFLFCDSPLAFHCMAKRIPVRFMPNSPTFFHVVNKGTGEDKIFRSAESFYIFHYADSIETEDKIELYASLYDTLDFSKIDIQGRYRKVVLDKQTGGVEIIRNPVLETMNLEFPITYGTQRIFLRNTKNAMDGVVICDGLDIVRIIDLEDKYIAGEPRVIYSGDNAYLVAFAYSRTGFDGFLLLISLDNDDRIEIPLDENLTLGFHSIFIPPFTTMNS